MSAGGASLKFVLFCHSLISDWNHGNAHFLRGIASELKARGHTVSVYEPQDAWSVKNLVAERGPEALTDYRAAYPQLESVRFDPADLDPGDAVRDADVVIVHEWNDHKLVADLGRLRARNGNFKLLFHDTHHRSVTERVAMDAYDLAEYDGVLAFGQVITDIYRREGWARRAWTWHEAADTRVFYPHESGAKDGDLVWIGNWGDDERTAELDEFLIEPVRRLGLKARIHGVRYPRAARQKLADAGIEYCGWLPNYKAAEVFSRYRVTVHVPRRPYVRALPGIPTIRMFEALACGIPLVTAPWDDAEGLFSPGQDYLVARDGREMESHLRFLIDNPDAAALQARRGLQTVRSRHTCAKRVDELLTIAAEPVAEKEGAAVS